MALDNAATMTRVINTTEEPHTSDDSDADQKPTCYFLDKLPRELRDLIYGYLGADYSAVKPTDFCASNIRLKDGPLLTLLLVNKQIHEEYWKVCRQMTKIVVVDGYENDGIGAPRIPETLIKVKTAHALLLVVCGQCHDDQHTSRYCDLRKEFQDQNDWLHQFIAEMPHINELYVKINFPWPNNLWQGHSTQWPQSPYAFDIAKALQPFAEVAGVTKLTAVGHTGDCMNDGKGGIAADSLEMNESHRYVCWTKEGGWDDLSGEQPPTGVAARRDHADLEGFEYR